jgi:NifU-like domain
MTMMTATTTRSALLISFSCCYYLGSSFVPPSPYCYFGHHRFITTIRGDRSTPSFLRSSNEPTIVSPFDDRSGGSGSNADGATTTTTTTAKAPSMAGGDKEPLDLTWENVELVLDEMRPYLIQDGGNVVIADIDGPVVRLELQVRVVCLHACMSECVRVRVRVHE